MKELKNSIKWLEKCEYKLDVKNKHFAEYIDLQIKKIKYISIDLF